MADEMQGQQKHIIPVRLIVIFVVLAAGVLAAGYLTYRGLEKQYRADREHELTAIADIKVAELTQWRSERMADAELIYRNAAFSKLVRRYLNNSRAGAERQLREWLGRYHTQYDRVRLIDPQGITRMSFPSGRPATSVTVNERIAEVLQSGAITIVDLYRNEHDHRIYLDALVPILDVSAGKRVIGLLDLRVDPEKYLYPFILRWPTPSRTAETIIVRRDGDGVLFLSDLIFTENAALSLRIPLNKTDVLPVMAVLGRSGIVEGLDYRGVPEVADIRRVPDSPWFLITRITVSEIYAPARRQLWLVIGFMAALLFGSGAGLAFVWRQQSMGFYEEQYRAAEALRKSEAELKEAQRLALIASWDWDAIGDAMQWSAEYYNIFNLDPNGPTPNYIDHLNAYTQGGRERLDAAVKRAMQTGEPYELDLELANPDATRRWIVARGEVKRDADGRIVGLRGTVQNITGRKQAEEELKIMNQALKSTASDLELAYRDMESFSYSVSHDLRAPLRIIGGLSDIVLQDYQDKLDDEGQKLLRLIQGNTKRMDQLVQALLDLSRAGRQEIMIDKIDMDKAAALIAGDIKAMAPERNIAVDIKVLPPAYGDLKLIRQVLANFLSNAVKFTKHRDVAHIEVGGRREGSENIYYVKDNGAGFDMEQANRLFKVFQRLHSLEDFEGIGIGLSIVQRIVQRHGGRVWAEGRPGEGATFYFSLPRGKT